MTCVNGAIETIRTLCIKRHVDTLLSIVIANIGSTCDAIRAHGNISNATIDLCQTCSVGGITHNSDACTRIGRRRITRAIRVAWSVLATELCITRVGCARQVIVTIQNSSLTTSVRIAIRYQACGVETTTDVVGHTTINFVARIGCASVAIGTRQWRMRTLTIVEIASIDRACV